MDSKFPFLLGGTFIEATTAAIFAQLLCEVFPFLLGGTFIEAGYFPFRTPLTLHFPSFWEGLSLRPERSLGWRARSAISLPFGRDFH